MENNKYKILVLSDLKSTTDSLLKSSVSLAKMIDGNVMFLHVKKPTDVIDSDSQLSAIRTLNKEHLTLDNKIKKLLNPISKDYDLKLDHAFTFGNVKSEIDKYISEYKPDIIVLGKKKSKALSFIGDNVVDLVLKKHHGPIMITAGENSLKPNKAFALGVLNNAKDALNIKFSEALIANTTKPLKVFKIIENSESSKTNTKKEEEEEGTIGYVFEKGNNALKNLSNYLLKNDINLLCVNANNANNGSGFVNFEVDEVINKVAVSLLVNNSQNDV